MKKAIISGVLTIMMITNVSICYADIKQQNQAQILKQKHDEEDLREAKSLHSAILKIYLEAEKY